METGMDTGVDRYIGKTSGWQEELEVMRKIVLDCGLTEELKWGHPCYMHNGRNIVLLQGFRNYCALMFFKGALLSDADGILQAPGESSQAVRQLRFTGVGEVREMESVLKAYIYEAVEVEKAGLKVQLKKTEDYPVPEEFQVKMEEIPALKAAFETLTPGRQRAYLLYFSQPKHSKTRASRVEKYMQKILCGKGLTDERHSHR